MAYSSSNMSCIVQGGIGGKSVRFWGYVIPTEDDEETIAETDYFNSALRIGLEIGDIITCVKQTGGVMPFSGYVTQISPTVKVSFDLGLQIGDSQFSSAFGTVPLNLSTRFSDVIDVREYGARYDGTTYQYNHEAINAAIVEAAGLTFGGYEMTTLIKAPTGGFGWIYDTINLTSLRYRGMTLQLGRLHGATNGKPVIDAMNSLGFSIDKTVIVGHTANTPSIGLQIGRTAHDTCQEIRLSRSSITGHFTKTALRNLAAESMLIDNCRIRNYMPDMRAYAIQLDRYNFWDTTSEFVTQTNSVDNPSPGFTHMQNSIRNSTIQTIGDGVPMWLGGLGQFNMYSCYVSTELNGNDAGQTHYCTIYFAAEDTPNGTHAQYNFDIVHFEGDVPDAAFMISGKAGVETPVLRGFKWVENALQVPNYLFAIDPDSDITQVLASDFTVHIAGGNTTPALFEEPAKWSIRGGDILLPDAAMWTEPALFRGIRNIDSTLQSAIGEGSGVNIAPSDIHGFRVRVTDDNKTAVHLRSDAGGSTGVTLDTWHNSASPEDNNTISRWRSYGNNDAAEQTLFGTIRFAASDVSDGTEDGALSIDLKLAGADARVMDLSAVLVDLLTGLSTETANLRVGHGRSGDGNTNFALISDQATYPNGSFTITRAAGANGTTTISHHGTGQFQVGTEESAILAFRTGGASRWGITAGGTFYPVTTSASDIGTNANRARNTFSNLLTLTPVTAASLSNIASGYNTANKYAGTVVFDSTNNRLMVASGSAAADPWYVADGSASVTPA